MSASSAISTVPNTNSVDAPDQDFLVHLRSTIRRTLLSDKNTRISAADSGPWMLLLKQLHDAFLVSFSFNDIWNAQPERVQLVEGCLETVELILNRVDGVLVGNREVPGSKDLSKKLFCALFTLCHTLDLYTDTEIVPRDGISMPATLRDIACRTATLTLRRMGGSHPPTGDEPMWKILRDIVQELLNLSHDIMNPILPLTFPFAALLFCRPRLRLLNPDGHLPSQDQVMMIFSSDAEIPRFLSLIVDITVNALHPTILCDWFLFDMEQKVAENVQQSFEYCLSAPSTGRAKALAKILSALPFKFLEKKGSTPLMILPYRLLRERLLAGPSSAEWDIADNYFAGVGTLPPLSRTEFVDILNLVREQKLEGTDADFGYHQSAAIAYVNACVSKMETIGLKSLSDAIADANIEAGECAGLTEPVQKRIAELQHLNPPDSAPVMPWREKVLEIVCKLVHPQELDWMEDDDDQRYVQHALNDVVSIYKSRQPPTTPDSRLSVLESAICLGNLLSQQVSVQWSTLAFCTELSNWLLQGSGVPNDAKRNVFMMVARMLKLHAMNESSDETLHPLARLIFRNLLDSNASVRLNAGKALGALVALYGQRNVDVWDRSEECFAQFYPMMEDRKLTIKESAILIVGGMAKDPSLHVDIIGQALCFLVAQLGRPNPVLKGSAYIQILAAVKSHKKPSAYPLLLPYMAKIAPFLVTRMCSEPSILLEACRLMGITIPDFLRTTLSKTLPSLFANQEYGILEAIGKEVAHRPSTLFLNHCHEVLAHVFLLDSAKGTQNGLKSITRLLSSAASSGGQRTSVDIQGVVKSCLIPLLAQLIASLGDRSQQEAQNALNALKKVAEVLHTNDSQSADLGAFLKTYMLGLISHINDMLQDVQGKKPVEVKKKILRSLGVLMVQIGSAVASVAPQILATFQTMVAIPELSEDTLYSWHQFITLLSAEEIAPHVGLTSAALVASWPVFTPTARALAKKTLQHIIVDKGSELVNNSLDDLVDISIIPELHDIHKHLLKLQGELSPVDRLRLILERAMTNNHAVVLQSLYELKQFMLVGHQDLIRKLASGDMFDPLVGQILTALLTAAGREMDEGDPLRPLAFECLSIIGAVDPDRCELKVKESSMIVYQNFDDNEESVAFALHLITDLLVEAFRSTSDMRYQSHLAFTIQELLRFCHFTPALVAPAVPGQAVPPKKVRVRWNSLPKHVLETVTPLLEARYNLVHTSSPSVQHPIYPERSTYREWIQLWTIHLISEVSDGTAKKIFGVFPSVIRNKDVAVAHSLLPHLVLNVLLSGTGESSSQIRLELLAVLEDQVDPASKSSSDKKILSAQAVFVVLDHLNRWLRKIRQDITSAKDKNNRLLQDAQGKLLKVDSVLSNINQDLLAKAALQCKAYALSLMNFESRIVTLRERDPNHHELPTYYEWLHEIYAYLDEPDGMEGISTMILSPSLEHQIRHHESSGHWTSAQSCWELRLQQSPDNVDYHLGLLRCLRNLGHYDTLRTHVRGVLTRNPDWQPALAGFQIESAWMVGAWDDVQSIVASSNVATPQLAISRLLLCMRSRDPTAISHALTDARLILGAPIAAAGAHNYRRSYEAMLDLHLTHELETIYTAISSAPEQAGGVAPALADLSEVLSARLDATLPTFRTREPILSMRRTAFALVDHLGSGSLKKEIGRSWLASAKIARKAGQWQTAYSAMLQSQQSKTEYSFMESAKLVKAMGEPLRALQQLENSMHSESLLDDDSVVDLTRDNNDKMKAKVRLLRARWMNESERFDARMVLKTFTNVTGLMSTWESGHYYLGKFQDECYKNLPIAERLTRGLKMNLSTVKAYASAINLGSKYIYQTVPRLLTLWLDLGEDPKAAGSETYKFINQAVAQAIKVSPVYKWFTAFPQIVSRIGHLNTDVYKQLARLIGRVIQSYPNQALWLFVAVMKSKKTERSNRGKVILERAQGSHASSGVAELVRQSLAMTDQLLNLCNFDGPQIEKKKLVMSRDFPALAQLGRSDLIIPLQESLTASLPPISSSDSVHQPFPSDVPTFAGFAEEIEIMHSIAKPRKITIHGSNGQTYMFLGKPKDDLRKDARLMDFNAIINKLLKANSESRRRQLHIRTYGVVTLNEECGFIQWVPHTRPVRPVLLKLYQNRQISPWSSDMADVFAKIKDMDDPSKAGDLFTKKVLSQFPPVFHEWFIETFPEPTVWLTNRLTYARTAAVMAMVGFILGLGDRHCENVLLDENTGDLIHVDFNCLFEKGKALDTPERVPFRLTQNLVDALGVTGVEGVFRTACEVTMQLLRDNKDSLMSVLDAFIHDPLVEWEEEKMKLDRHRKRDAADPQRKNVVKPATDLRMLAKNALKGIEKKLRGLYRPSPEKHAFEKEVSTSNLVQLLIQEATDVQNLARMYPGWASWH